MSQKIETLAMEINELTSEIKRLQGRKDMKRDILAQEMVREGLTEYRVPMPGYMFDLKVTRSERKSRKVDKAQLALDLGVAESAINLPFLLHAVEEGKLTAQKYEDYVETFYNNAASVRQVKA